MMSIILMLILLLFMLNYWNKFNLKISFWMMIMFIYLLFLNNYMNISKIYWVFMMDKISYYLIILSFWILIIIFMSIKKLSDKLMVYMNLFLILFLFLFFISSNLFLMYLYFEVSLIPIMMVILFGGYSLDRIYASLYFILYTLIFSLPLLLVLFYMENLNFSLEFSIMYNINEYNFMLFFFLNMAFLVKLPMFLIHIWLPKAHVEAPVYGSMVLAAILLKMGSFAIYRLMMFWMKLYLYFNLYFIILNLIGGIYLSFVCLIQVDMKMLIAYSSVVHMSLLISGMLTGNVVGLYGGYLMMIAHGLCSSGLFYMVNIIYDRTSSRSIYMNKGIGKFMPNFSVMWFMMCICNLSSPFSLNLVSEILLLNSLIMWMNKLVYLMMMMCFFSASYSMYLFSIIFHGSFFFNNKNYFDSMVNENLLIILHLIPLNLLIFNMMIFI